MSKCLSIYLFNLYYLFFLSLSFEAKSIFGGWVGQPVHHPTFSKQQQDQNAEFTSTQPALEHSSLCGWPLTTGTIFDDDITKLKSEMNGDKEKQHWGFRHTRLNHTAVAGRDQVLVEQRTSQTHRPLMTIYFKVVFAILSYQGTSAFYRFSD